MSCSPGDRSSPGRPRRPPGRAVPSTTPPRSKPGRRDSPARAVRSAAPRSGPVTGCVPQAVEFWHGSPDRLHRRLRYDRTPGTAAWTHQRLQP
ncbi:pyridoxine 5'-phosphate oxidase C-terminal domain-containing protein [Salinifilum ghardaiensis]